MKHRLRKNCDHTRILQILIVSAAVIITAGCEKFTQPGQIDSDIIIKMWETVDSTGRTFQFNSETEKIYNCFNYYITNSYSRSERKIEIDYGGTTLGNVCLTALGPARAEIDLGALPNGVYDLKISVGQKKSGGKLVVSRDYYETDFKLLRQVKFEYNRLYRIPAGTIWGTIGYHNENTEPLVLSFIDSLKIIGATRHNFQQGEYGYFKTDADGEIVPPHNHGYNYIKTFIFKYTGTPSELKRIVKYYGQNYGDSLKIRLLNTNGEEFRSWPVKALPGQGSGI